MAPMWDRIDPLAEKYYGISPYAYCGGDPVNFGDYDGRDMCVLTAPNGADGYGHMAILIQGTDQNWYLYSKNGVGDYNSGFSGPNEEDVGDDVGAGKIVLDEDGNTIEVGWESPQEFLDSDKNNDGNGNVEYTEGFVIESSRDNDTKARNAACSEISKPYFLLGSNCAYTVQKALEAAGKSSGHFKMGSDDGLQSLKIPNQRYRMIVRENKGYRVWPSK